MSVPEINAVQAFMPVAQPKQSNPVESTSDGQTRPNGQASDPQAGQTSGGSSLDMLKLHKGIEKLNQILSASQTKVELAQGTPPNQIWLNVVDSTTGHVIEKLPPEGLRQFMETHNAKGLAMDMRL